MTARVDSGGPTAEGRPPRAVSVVIFGASGDLTRRKLLPALYNNFRKGRLPEQFRIVGAARRPYSTERFRDLMRQGVKEFSPGSFNEETWAAFEPHIAYTEVDLDQPADFARLEQTLRDLEGGPAGRVYYLATAPEYYGSTATALGEAGSANEDEGFRRLVVEKPYGTDGGSARALDEQIHRHWRERQVYRIDHYLGKETAQNILFLRFANTIFEPIWNRNYVNNVQVTVAETVDVDHRAGYYDQSGVVRDMFQNHLLQLLSLVAMEPPASFNADAVRNEKVKLLTAIRPIAPGDTVRGQYEGYTKVEGVAPRSKTATFAAMRLNIDNWRWRGVPFYLRSGKALARRTTEIVIQFHRPPHVLFDPGGERELTPNLLTLNVQPHEGMHLTFQAKVPGAAIETRAVDMSFHYEDGFEGVELPEAYERLLLDAILGDAALFARSDEIERAWALIDPVLAAWEETNTPRLQAYARGSWGPARSDLLLAREGRRWWATSHEAAGT